MSRARLQGLTKRTWNSAVFWAMFSTALRLGGFVFVLPIALRRLSADQLGVWYTMVNLGGLFTMIELGFSPCIGRFASYYFAGAKKVPRLGVEETPTAEDTPPNLPALAGLVAMARTLYLRFAIVVFILMAVGGSWWMGSKFGPIFLKTDVLGPYLLYSAGTAWTMSGLFWADIQFGVHQVKQSFTNSIGAQILNYAFTLLLFWMGFGLMALAVGQLIMALLPRYLARKQFQKALPIEQVVKPQAIEVGELWPLCWRSGLAAFAAFLLLRSLTLVAAVVLDLKATASLGLSMQLVFVVTGISQIWLSVKYPVITGLRARRDEVGLRRLVGQRIPLCLATFALGSIVLILAAPWAIHLMGSNTPLLPTSTLALLTLVCGLDLFMGMNTAIMLSGNRVPHLASFLISGAATVLSALLLGHFFGVTGIILAPVGVQLCWTYWWTPLACWRSMALKAPAPLEASA